VNRNGLRASSKAATAAKAASHIQRPGADGAERRPGTTLAWFFASLMTNEDRCPPWFRSSILRARWVSACYVAARCYRATSAINYLAVTEEYSQPSFSLLGIYSAAVAAADMTLRARAGEAAAAGACESRAGEPAARKPTRCRA